MDLKTKLDAGRQAAAKDEGWYRIDDGEGNFPNPFFQRAGRCRECAHEYGLSSASDDVAQYECYPGICNWQRRTDRNRQIKAAALIRRLQTWVDNPREWDEYETITRRLAAMGVDPHDHLRPVADDDGEDFDEGAEASRATDDDWDDNYLVFLEATRAREIECGLMPGWRERVIQDLKNMEENNDTKIY